MRCVRLSSGVFFRVLRGKRRRVNVAAAQLLCLLLFVISQLLTPQVAQAAPSGVTVNRYFCHWHDEVSTTNTTWTEIEPSTGYYPLQLTFTPPSTATYLILASVSMSSSSTSGITYVRLLQNSTVTGNPEFTPRAVGDYAAISWHPVRELTGGVEYTFKMQFKTNDASYTASVKNAHLLIFQMSDYHHTSATANSTTSEDYVDRLPPLIFTPSSAGAYLVLASAGMTVDSTLYAFYFQLTHNGTPQGEVCKEVSVAMQNRSYTIMRVISFDSGQQTLGLQYKTEKSTATVYGEGAKITAIRLSDLGIDANSVDIDGSETTTSTTYVDVPGANTTFSPSPSQYGDYLVLAFSLLSGDKTNQKAYSRLLADDTPHGEMIFRPNDTKDRVPFFDIDKERFAPGSHTIRIQSKTENANMTVTTENARILAIKVNTLQSYSDAGVTECTTFTSANHTAYIYGYCYEYDYEATPPAGMGYHIAYYDNGGAKVASVADTSNYNRSIDTAYDLTTDKSAQAGTWHAVVYQDNFASPPETYTASDNNSVMEVAFTVEQSAIPEFPAVIAGVVVAGMCFGIYCWMRKRNPGYVRT